MFLARQERGETAIHSAVSMGYVYAVQVLITAGADVSVPNLDGWTPLDFAFLLKKAACLKVLQKAGAQYGRNNY